VGGGDTGSSGNVFSFVGVAEGGGDNGGSGEVFSLIAIFSLKGGVGGDVGAEACGPRGVRVVED
ncbi:hypothetical protein Tco_0560032, partial [Tanacetum coccineum]